MLAYASGKAGLVASAIHGPRRVGKSPLAYEAPEFFFEIDYLAL
jgi:hypothetical protein